MIDFIKLETKPNDINGFLQRLNVGYKGEFVGETFEVTGKYSAKIKNIKLKILPSGWLIIAGSIHQFWNDGKHNYNDFYYA
jgi:hypothetical protein